MRSFKEIKSDYYFTSEDENRLASIKQLMMDNAEKTMQTVYEWILKLGRTSQFFRNEERMQYVSNAHKKWFIDLFGGIYDNKYYEKLIRIGQIHVKFSVDPHYLNRSINLVRNSCIDIINNNIENIEERTKVLISIEKILDINLDVITSAYIEEEIRSYSSLYRVKNILVSFSEKLAQLMNFILVFALIGLSLAITALFLYDIKSIITSNIEQGIIIEHGIITALGSMLMLWIVIELINTQIKHLKGGKFRISVFVGVALVAFIRETLIKALKHEAVEQMYFLIALILTLGVVFWLVTKAEEKNQL